MKKKLLETESCQIVSKNRGTVNFVLAALMSVKGQRSLDVNVSALCLNYSTGLH